MRFNLCLSLLDRNRNVLPVNYQYELSAWIYKVINHSDPAFADWLHNKGYSNDNNNSGCLPSQILLYRNMRLTVTDWLLSLIRLNWLSPLYLKRISNILLPVFFVRVSLLWVTGFQLPVFGLTPLKRCQFQFSRTKCHFGPSLRFLFQEKSRGKNTHNILPPNRRIIPGL